MRVLAIDGGGIRGVIPAVWLERLERATKLPTVHHFDLLAGTSTGAILAAALASRRRAADLVDLYAEASEDIFPHGLQRLIGRLADIPTLGISQPSYPAAGIEGVLRDVFGELRMGDLSVKTMLVAYDVRLAEPRVFKSWDSRHEELLVRHVCRASAAAPTYLPGVLLDGQALIDGGVAANSPGACALAEARRLRGGTAAGIRLLSLGTGSSPLSIRAEEIVEWGTAQWSTRILPVLLMASVRVSDYLCRQMLADGDYLRIQAALTPDLMELDEPAHVSHLKAAANRELQAGALDALRHFVAR